MSLEAAFEIARLAPALQQIADALQVEVPEVFADLPMLRHWWPMSLTNDNGDAMTYSFDSADRLNRAGGQYGFDGHAYAVTSLPDEYLKALNTAVGKASGVNSWVPDDLLGITLGCWAYMIDNPAVQVGIISRWASAGSRVYSLGVTSGQDPIFEVSFDLTNGNDVQGPELNYNQWYFLVGRVSFPTRTFPQDATLSLFVDAGKTDLVLPVSNSLLFATPTFEVGRYRENNARIFGGRIRDVFFCEAALSDAVIEQIRRTSLPPAGPI